jgi:O-antigen/teichoic acid export membrane protein
VSPILTSIDRFVIGALRGASAITFYTVPAGLTTRASLLPGALARAIFPDFSSVSSTEAATLAEEAVRTLNAIMIPIVVLGLWAMRPFLVLSFLPKSSSKTLAADSLGILYTARRRLTGV